MIMNLTEMVDSDAKRLVDFAAGLIFGLRGSIERVTNKVFLLSPANVEVTAEDKARIAERGSSTRASTRAGLARHGRRGCGRPGAAVRQGRDVDILKIVLTYVLWLYLLLLIGRLIFSWIQAFSRTGRRTGSCLVVAEAMLHSHRSATEIPKALHPAAPAR